MDDIQVHFTPIPTQFTVWKSMHFRAWEEKFVRLLHLAVQWDIVPLRIFSFAVNFSVTAANFDTLPRAQKLFFCHEFFLTRESLC